MRQSGTLYLRQWHKPGGFNLNGKACLTECLKQRGNVLLEWLTASDYHTPGRIGGERF
jgi:hypothetical protein